MKRLLRGEIYLLIIERMMNVIKSFLHYMILSVPVSLTSVMILAVLKNTTGNDLSFLKYLSFIHPSFAEGTFNIGIPEIMNIYFVISLFLMIIIGGGRLFLRYVMHIKPQKTSLGAKMIIGIIILTPIYVTGGISVMKEANSSRPGILSMILFFYFLSIAFYSVFINLEHVHKKLH